MRWFPGEADGARDAPSSPGLPRGTQFDHAGTAQGPARAPRASALDERDESPGDHPPDPWPARSLLTEPPRHATLEAVCAALADAFLSSEEWTREALSAAGDRCIPAHRTLSATAAFVAVSLFREAPRDSPRLLADELAASPRVGETYRSRSARAPIVIRSRPVAPTIAREPRYGLPRIDDTTALAGLLDLTVGHLDALADLGHWNRRAAPGPLHHYRYEWRTRPGRTPRLLEVPLHRLRTTQRAVLDLLLLPLPLHDAAHGFVRGRSAVSCAGRHVGSDVVVSADLVSFFASVPAVSVLRLFRGAGFPERVARMLTGLCTHQVPVAVLAAMPPGGSPEERHALRTRLRTSHLPQGSPTSPALANLTVARLDRRLHGWAEAVDAVYTRYADDLAFSGGPALAARPDAFLRGVRRIVEDEGHSLNPAKSRVRRRGVRQSVTGIVVNDGPTTGRREYDSLKAILHNCVVHGPRSQNRSAHPEFRAHLLGRIGWVTQVNPTRGAALRAEFDRIDWDF